MSRLVVTRVITLGNGCAVVHKGSKNDNKLFLIYENTSRMVINILDKLKFRYFYYLLNIFSGSEMATDWHPLTLVFSFRF